MAVLPEAAPSLPASDSVQAILLPSGEMLICSHWCAAVRVFMTPSRGVEGLGFSPAFSRFSTSFFVPEVFVPEVSRWFSGWFWAVRQVAANRNRSSCSATG